MIRRIASLGEACPTAPLWSQLCIGPPNQLFGGNGLTTSRTVVCPLDRFLCRTRTDAVSNAQPCSNTRPAPGQIRTHRTVAQAIDQHFAKLTLSENGYLFPGTRMRNSHITTRQYARLVSKSMTQLHSPNSWMSEVGGGADMLHPPSKRGKMTLGGLFAVGVQRQLCGQTDQSGLRWRSDLRHVSHRHFVPIRPFTSIPPHGQDHLYRTGEML